MKNEKNMLMELPPDQDIECVTEVRDPMEPSLIRKEIRYKDGLVATLLQDFHNTVFSVSIRAQQKPFWLSSNRVLRAG